MTSCPRSRPPAPPIPQLDWEPHKARIKGLYMASSLPDVRNIMARDHGFTATECQYRKRFGKWEIQKQHRGVQYRRRLRGARSSARPNERHEADSLSSEAEAPHNAETEVNPQILPWGMGRDEPWTKLRCLTGQELDRFVRGGADGGEPV
ncbi:hypothetical protein GJ744_000342 [Endocarpon pusillum]|uniref:Clr5 domain-containing protein n=1 Tax=Endocarpon pusillum TaxID=364733 RepID=A0A8H7AP07_9EURO|nr:hypothetical protein GJ744_000342 [Endocarpon pusillum]